MLQLVITRILLSRVLTSKTEKQQTLEQYDFINDLPVKTIKLPSLLGRGFYFKDDSDYFFFLGAAFFFAFGAAFFVSPSAAGCFTFFFLPNAFGTCSTIHFFISSNGKVFKSSA